MRDFKEITILDNVTPVAITSSTDATPIVVTKASHGLTTGDQVLIFGHTTNVAANGIRKVTVVTANTFSLQSIDDGTNIAGSGAGAGGATGYFMTAPKILSLQDFKVAVLEVTTTGTATTTPKFYGSLGKSRTDASARNGDTPNFGATASRANPYTTVQIVPLDTGVPLDGDTGIVIAGADITAKLYEVNINALKYGTMFPASWTAGAITIKAQLFTGV